jgi:hypothetical protein
LRDITVIGVYSVHAFPATWDLPLGLIIVRIFTKRSLLRPIVLVKTGRDMMTKMGHKKKIVFLGKVFVKTNEFVCRGRTNR